jgi:S-adenosylmethionine synthetase
MVGYATSETAEMLPLEVVLSRQLNQYIFKHWPHDGKTQITLKDGKIQSAVASFQHAKQTELDDMIKKWLKGKPQTDEVLIYANPFGDWDLGGFEADSGLTGRKLVVDNYGPQVPIGGGAFSGKDATKVDRSAAYMARRIAVDYLKKHKSREVFCYLAYAIGIAQPVEATVVIDGRSRDVKGYDLTPRGIIQHLDLLKPQYEATARYGHFGNGFAWDK